MGLFERFKQRNTASDLFVITGLSNPGQQYAQTKHNVGFWTIDRLAEKYKIQA